VPKKVAKSKRNHRFPAGKRRFYGCGRRTRTSDLRVMSPTSYQLLYPAILVPETGVEPARDCSHGILSPGRLPIPPLRHRVAPVSFERLIILAQYASAVKIYLQRFLLPYKKRVDDFRPAHKSEVQIR